MASRFWVGGTGTWDASDITHWAASTGGAGGQSVPTSGDSVTFDGNSGGGTCTVNTNINLGTGVLTTSAYTGTLDFATNNNNISISALTDAATGVHTINLGNGTWTITATAGNVWAITTSANLTLNCNSSTILLSATATANRNFQSAAKTYNNVTVTNPTFNGQELDFTVGGTTYANLTFTNVGFVRLPSSASITVSGTITYNGTPSGPGMLMAITPATVTIAGAAVLNWVALTNITKAGAGSITAINSFNCGALTGITVIPPGARVIGG